MNKKLLITKSKTSFVFISWKNLKKGKLKPLEFNKELKNDLRRLIKFNVVIKDIPTNDFGISLSMTLKDCTNLIEKYMKWKLTSSSLTIPRIYCLPKIHKSVKKLS